MDNGISLATGPAGSLHVAYYDGVNGLFYTSNMGGSFSTPTRLTEYGDAPCLTVDDAGTAHLLYQATPSDALQHGATYTNNASGDFATPQTIFQNYDWADDRSQRWCVLRDNYVYMAINVDGIGSYLLHDLQIPRLPFETHPLVQDYDARTDTLTSLALDNDDHVHVAYMSTYPQNGAPDNVASDIMVTNNTTGEFSEPITVPVSGGYYSKSPSLAVDGEGTEHVVFLRTENQLDAEGIFYYTHNRSGAFISPTIITSDGIGVAQVVADRDGHAYIVYPSGDNLYYVDNLTGNFSTPLSVGTAGSFTPFSMALDNENMVHVAYMGEDTNLYYTHMTATGFMSPTHVSIVDALANEFSDPSLALDSSGNAHIVFESSDAPLNEQTIYVNNQGSTFAYTETVYTQGPRSHSPAIAIDGLDHIHVVHLSPGQNWPNNIEYSVNRGDGFAPSQILWNWGSAYGENRWFAVDHQYRAHLAFYFPIHSMEADIFYIQGFVGDFYRITGYIWNTMGSGIPGVDVRFTARSGETLTTTTDATGYFSEGEYAGTFANGIYTVTVASESEHFIPEQQVVTVDGTHEVGITFRRVQAVEAATIGGPITGTVGTTYPFSLDFTPLSATQPLSYTWHPIPLEGQGTANITYRWATSGTYTISATVTNISGEATDNHTITIQAQAPEEKYLLYLPLLLRL
jgi:hypothetical protein